VSILLVSCDKNGGFVFCHALFKWHELDGLDCLGGGGVGVGDGGEHCFVCGCVVLLVCVFDTIFFPRVINLDLLFGPWKIFQKMK